MNAKIEELEEMKSLSKEDIISLLKAEGAEQEQLFQTARDVRKAHGIDNVLLRGVIEISNFCQKKCDYCAMNCNNAEIVRYRMDADEIIAVAADIKKAGIKVAFLQSGQDPLSDSIVEEVIPRIKKELDMNVLLCLGEKKEEQYRKFKELGADSYIIKFETSDPVISEQTLHTPKQERDQCIQWVKSAGLKLGTGNIIGLPNQNLEHLAEDILYACSLEPDFVSSAPFIPSKNTPLENTPVGDCNLTLNTMAILRILLKDIRIPSISALEGIRKGGQVMGLNAGANIITINFTPEATRQKYVIYKKGRFVVKMEHALKTIEQAGLKILQEN